MLALDNVGMAVVDGLLQRLAKCWPTPQSLEAVPLDLAAWKRSWTDSIFGGKSKIEKGRPRPRRQETPTIIRFSSIFLAAL